MKVGDCVYLKGQKKKLTVTDVTDLGPPFGAMVHCVWYNESGDMDESDFNEACLVPATEVE